MVSQGLEIKKILKGLVIQEKLSEINLVRFRRIGVFERVWTKFKSITDFLIMQYSTKKI